MGSGSSQPARTTTVAAPGEAAEIRPSGDVGPVTATGPATVAVVAVAPIRTAVAWREVTRPGGPLTFLPLIRGVLARSAAGYHEVDAHGALGLRPTIDAPTAPVLGVWPDNAWYIENVAPKFNLGVPTGNGELRPMRLSGKRRWVPQSMSGTEQSFENVGQRFQIGGTGGLLVERAGKVSRLGDKAVDPVLGLDIGGELVALFESQSGRVYQVRSKDDALYVQRDCADRECVTREAVRLPLGPQWSFTQPVTRQQDSTSAVAAYTPPGTKPHAVFHSPGPEAEVYNDPGAKHHLLHYESDGWKLEPIAGMPTGLWPTNDGGLWILIGAQLLHRDPGGVWRDVALPAGAKAVSAAMREDFSELWISAMVGDAPIVFATAANVQSSPPVPGTP